MKAFLAVATEYSVMAIDAIALVVIMAGTLEAFVRGSREMLAPGSDAGERNTWLRYTRWLVAGLTFQLAADIIETSTAPTWTQIGRIAAIAAIRTFLSYFLERDISEVRERQREVAVA